MNTDQKIEETIMENAETEFGQFAEEVLNAGALPPREWLNLAPAMAPKAASSRRLADSPSATIAAVAAGGGETDVESWLSRIYASQE